MRPADSAPAPGEPTLKSFQDLLDGEAPEAAAVQDILCRLEAEGLAEAALALLRKRRARPGPRRDARWDALRLGVESAAEKARQMRLHQWQLDPARRSFRLCFEVRHPASGLYPSALLHALAQALLEAGLPVAMGLEKAPRPVVALGPPLPPGIEGLQEWADCALREPASFPAEQWPGRLAAHCPPGLRLLEARPVPNHSSPVLELAREARWRWDCPEDLLDLARPRLQHFLESPSFEIEKTGKVEGRKAVKRVEVRDAVLDMEWRGKAIFFSTRIQPGEALSPLKLLAGILGLEPARITGLSRLEVLLAKDARLGAAHKYEPKLHNIFEDAVLLESDAPPRTVEDDDELLLDQ